MQIKTILPFYPNRKVWRALQLFLMMMVLSMHSFAAITVEGQQVKINESGISLSQVIKQIEKQVSAEFVYKSEDLKDYQRLEINEEGSVDEVLKAVLQNTDLQLQVRGDVYVISKKEPAVVQPAQQEKKTVKGKVVDDKGIPLPGVSVVIKGTNVGVATNIDGDYSLDLNQTNAVLIYSFVGMKIQEIAYTGQAIQNVTLTDDAEMMAEVIVTGYQTLPKERATGSFTTINTEELDSKITSDVLQNLESTVPGLLYTEKGVTIRGTSTFNGNKQPLLVVDGYPIEGNGLEVGTDLSDISKLVNPEDIKSVNVLKDAAAASIWGIRAANGVIVITTKSGQRDKKLSVNFSANLEITEKPDYDRLNYASTESIVDYELDRLKNKHVVQSNKYQSYSSLQGYYNDYLADGNLGKFNGIVDRLKKNNILDEYTDEFHRNAINQTYNVSIQGGGKSSSHYLSVKYLNKQTNVKDSDEKRFTVNLRNEWQLHPRVKVNANAYVFKSNTERPNQVNYKSLSIYDSFYNADGSYAVINRDWDQKEKEKRMADGFMNWNYNPVEDFNKARFTREDLSIRLQGGVEWEIIDGLTINSNVQYEHGNADRRNLYDKDSYYIRNITNQFRVKETIPPPFPWYPPTVKIYEFPEGGMNQKSHSKYYSKTFRNQLSFKREFNLHAVNVLLGNEIRELENKVFTGLKQFGWSDDYYTYQHLNWNTKKGFDGKTYSNPQGQEDSNFQRNRFVSVYFNGGYTYDNRYNATLSARIDRANLFGTDSKYKHQPLWSVGAGWTVSNEDFFKSDFVNYLKVRATYGSNGNIKPNSSPYLTFKVGAATGADVLTTTLLTPQNDRLRYEKTKIFNFGVDFSLFNRILNGTVEYYDKRSTDLLANIDFDPTYGLLDPFSGASTVLQNVAAINNKGLDLSLNAKVIDKEVKLKFGLNYSYVKTKVNKYYFDNVDAWTLINNQAKRVGDPVAPLYAFKWAGLDNNGNPLTYNENGDAVISQSGEGLMSTTEEEVKLMGQLTPTSFGGLTTNLSYKNLSLRVLVSYKFGHHFRKPSIDYNRVNEGNTYMDADLERRWKKSGDEDITDVPGILDESKGHWDDRMRIYSMSSHLVEKADHIRLQEIALAYKFGVKKIGLKNAQLQLQARNLGILWKATDTDYDPEYLFTPRSAVYTVGLKFNF